VEKAENAVADTLIQAHGMLLEDLRKLEETAGSSAGDGALALVGRLDATRTHLLEHFRFEEHNGYMDAVRKREPRLERAIQQLADEHRQLARSLDALLAEARGATGTSAALRTQVQNWVEAVRQHEIRENDLIQDAFHLDIGPED
jgi:hypothetical protein